MSHKTGLKLMTAGMTLALTAMAGAAPAPHPPVQENQPPVADFAYTNDGYTFNFTDLSSDNDGVIVSRTWDFGTGETSVETNPSYTYWSRTQYYVTETVTDDLGATGSRTELVSILADRPGTELLINGDFDGDSPAPWKGTRGIWCDAACGSPPVSGTHYILLGGSPGRTQTLQQTVSIPASATTATLSFWYQILSEEPHGVPKDRMLVQVCDSAGNVLKQVDAYNQNYEWYVYQSPKDYDLSEFIGRTVAIRFVARTNTLNPTYFLIDNVSLTVQ